MWLPDAQDQRRAAREASTAIAMWEEADAATGSLDDEALAHVYLATAQLHLGQLDGAVDALRPILSLPPGRQISWIVKRLEGISEMFQAGPYLHSRLANETHEPIQAIATA